MMRYLAISQNDTTSKWDFMLYACLFAALIPVTTFGSSDMVLIQATLILGLYLFLWKRENVDMIIVWVLLYWCGVNLLSFLFLNEPGTSFKISTFIGSVLKLFIGYGLMKLCGIRFVAWFYRIVLVLSIISIPFFLIQLFQPSLFYSMPFNFAADIRAMDGHWNGIIYNFNNYHMGRNSGFAGEPGTFGYYLGLAMIFNLILNEGKFNRNFLILALVGLTTFSTTFYLSLVLFGLYFLSYSSWTTRVFYLVFCVLFGLAAFQLPFIGEKIDTYVEDTESMAESEIIRSRRVNRMATFVNHLTDVAKFPIGYGINEAQRTKNIYGNVIDGTNGFSRIALRFGIYGLIYFLVIYFKLFDKLTRKGVGAVMFTLIMLMYISANPMERDYYAMAIFWLYFLVNDEDVQQLIGRWNAQEVEKQLTLGYE